jgi:ubiquinone/menaquinone biosynthesis C-methylase UbiE
MKDHPIFARFYRPLERLVEKVERPYREETAGGARGRVLEIGAGTGANLSHYRGADVVVALEPEPTMLRLLRKRAREAGVRVLPVRGSATALPFRDEAFDTVVSSLVLCTVDDPPAAVREIRRALAPEGTLRFYEHVRSEDPALARKQDRLERVWGRFSGGCHPNRDTVATLSADFEVRYRSFDMPRGWIAAPHVIGEGIPVPPR